MDNIYRRPLSSYPIFWGRKKVSRPQTPDGSVTVNVTGEEATGSVGTVTAIGAAIILITGLLATGSVNSATATGTANVPVTGLEATAEVHDDVVTCYFDASDYGPDDTDGPDAWTDDANAFDGSITTFAISDETNSSLWADGTTAPTSGSPIESVYFSVYCNVPGTASLRLNLYNVTDAESLGFHDVDGTHVTGWSTPELVTAPALGWTWQKINDLSLTFNRRANPGQVSVYRVQLDVNESRVIGDANVPVTGLEATGSIGSVTVDTGSVPETVVVTGEEATASVAEGVVESYYFDASVSGPTDAQAVWTNDSNVFDGSLISGDSYTSSLGSDSNNALLGAGTTAPTSGLDITQVRARVYGYRTTSNILNAAVYTASKGELLGTPVNDTNPADWGNYVTLSTPTGGWTWTKASQLEVYLYNTVQASIVFTRQVDLEVTSGTEDVAVTAEANVSVTGETGTGAVGTVTIDGDTVVIVTGEEATSSVGTVSILLEQTLAVTGEAATGSVGSVTVNPEVSAPVTGETGTGFVGSVSILLEQTLAVTGAEATGFVGGVTVTAGGSVVTPVTGLSATGSVGSVSADAKTTVAVTGESASGLSVTNQTDLYYFDASVSGPTDAQSAWTGDSNAFDDTLGGGQATTSTAGSSTNNALVAAGTAASSGYTINGVIVDVGFSLGGYTTSPARGKGEVYTAGKTELLATYDFSVTGPGDFWASEEILTRPTGGWTQDVIEGLEVYLYQINTGNVNISSNRLRVYNHENGVTISLPIVVAVTGEEATGAVGTATAGTIVSITLTGEEATGFVGDETVTTEQTIAVTGLSATGSVGTATATIGTLVAVTGEAGTGSVGSVSVDAKTTVSVTGEEATTYISVGVGEARPYFDTSIAGPLDNEAVWSGEANYFDNDEITGGAASCSTNGSATTNALGGKGTSASDIFGARITQVKFRTYGGVTSGGGYSDVYTEGKAEYLNGVAFTNSTNAWTNETFLITPADGWTWDTIQKLENYAFIANGGTISLRANELVIDYVGGVVVSIPETVAVTGEEATGSVGTVIAVVGGDLVVPVTGEEGTGSVGSAIVPFETVLVTGEEGTGETASAAVVRNSYYDATNYGPTDPSADWTNDSNAFESNDGSYAYTYGTGQLGGGGSTTAKTGQDIYLVRVRPKTYGALTTDTLDFEVYSESQGELLASWNEEGRSTPDWGEWRDLNVPSGGWTWVKAGDTEIFAAGVSSNEARFYKAEIRVFARDAGVGVGVEIKGLATLTGEEATGSVGTATVSLVNGQLVTVTGEEGTGSVGTVTAGEQGLAIVTGLSATGSVGSVTAIEGGGSVLTGLEAQGFVGGIGVAVGGSISVPASGLYATGETGTVTITAECTVEVTDGLSAICETNPEFGLYLYYFDASDYGPFDYQDVWSTEDGYFDGQVGFSGSAGSTTCNVVGSPSITTNALHGRGTNAPTTGRPIKEVQTRMYGYTSSTAYGSVWDRNLSQLYGYAFRGTPEYKWGDLNTLTEPAGGWTWDKIANDLATWTYLGSTGTAILFSHQLAVSVETVYGEANVFPTGEEATGSVGTVIVTTNATPQTVPVTGLSATGSVGTVTVAGTSDPTVTLTGEEATGEVGSVRTFPVHVPDQDPNWVEIIPTQSAGWSEVSPASTDWTEITPSQDPDWGEGSID
jgi:hypothetical protein